MLDVAVAKNVSKRVPAIAEQRDDEGHDDQEQRVFPAAVRGTRKRRPA